MSLPEGASPPAPADRDGAAGSGGQAHVVIRPRSGWSPVDLRELWRYRELLVRFAARDVTLRYRQTALGVVWVVLQPLLAAGAFTVVFGIVAKLPSHGVPYFVFAYAGLMAWNAFASTITRGSASLVGNASLISKVFFPRMLLVVAVVWSTAIDFAVSLLLMVVLLVIFHVTPGPAVLLLPLWFLLMLSGAVGAALIAAPLMVRFRDVQYVLPVFVQLLLFASPVAYSLTSVPRSAHIFFLFNPMSGVLEGMRWSLLGTPPPRFDVIVYSTALAALVLVAGGLVFARMERDFADAI